jgi:uncharacterized protein YndB with AHSA1/START domain
MRRLLWAAGSITALGATATGAYVGLVTGRLSLDLGVGRRTRPLGPLTVEIAAPREMVYAVATAPYAERPPRAMKEKVVVLERSEGMVLAAHRTPVGARLVAVTVETVTFEPPARISFRLVRGPVPHVAETFELEETRNGTRLTYTGELGTDLGAVGECWGDLVERSWVAAVRESFTSIREAERGAAT